MPAALVIAPLRARHRRVITVLAVVVPALFVIGLMARRPVPAVAEHSGGPATPTLVVRSADSSPALTVVLDWAPESPRPDVLAYWQPERAGHTEISPDAILLGSLTSRRQTVLDLPDIASREGGRVLIYSLAHREVLTSAAVPH